MSSQLDVTVVIPTCGRPSLLRATLDALTGQDFDLTRAEIIVVCDGPGAEVRPVVEGVARCAPCAVRIIEQPRLGAAAARNTGIDAAQGRVIVMLDDDISASPGLLAAHLRHHREVEDVVVTGTLAMRPVPDELPHRRIVREWWDGEFREMAKPTHTATFRDFVTGNVSVARSRLVAVGRFDASFTGYGREDYELGLRLQRAGLRFVHEPAALGVHHYDKSPTEWLRMFRAMGRADVIFTRLHPAQLDEVMALSPFPRWPLVRHAIPWLERFVLARADRGGRAWATAAALTQGAHYWEGVHDEVRVADEERRLIAARRRARAAILHAERLQRGVLWKRVWRRLRLAGSRRVARSLGITIVA